MATRQFRGAVQIVMGSEKGPDGAKRPCIKLESSEKGTYKFTGAKEQDAKTARLVFDRLQTISKREGVGVSQWSIFNPDNLKPDNADIVCVIRISNGRAYPPHLQFFAAGAKVESASTKRVFDADGN